MDTKQEQQISFVNALKAVDEMKEEEKEIGGFAVEYNYINEIVTNMLKDNDTTVSLNYGGKTYTMKVRDLIRQPLRIANERIIYAIPSELWTVTE